MRGYVAATSHEYARVAFRHIEDLARTLATAVLVGPDAPGHPFWTGPARAQVETVARTFLGTPA